MYRADTPDRCRPGSGRGALSRRLSAVTNRRPRSLLHSGAVASLMAVLIVVAVLQLGLQATAARRIAGEPVHVAQIERGILRVSYRAALALGALMLLISPLLWRVLRLDGI